MNERLRVAEHQHIGEHVVRHDLPVEIIPPPESVSTTTTTIRQQITLPPDVLAAESAARRTLMTVNLVRGCALERGKLDQADLDDLREQLFGRAPAHRSRATSIGIAMLAAMLAFILLLAK